MVVLSIGECQKRILDAASRYKALREQHEKEGKKCPGPEGDGVLIFDEIRVVARLMWNSRNQRVVGFSMSHDDMANLLDVYQSLDPDAATRSTTYILQFLWRILPPHSMLLDHTTPHTIPVAKLWRASTFLVSC